MVMVGWGKCWSIYVCGCHSIMKPLIWPLYLSSMPKLLIATRTARLTLQILFPSPPAWMPPSRTRSLRMDASSPAVTEAE